MAILDKDVKILWGRAAGICSNPNCRKDLTRILDSKSSYNIGEMAHIIAKSSDGPRGVSVPGADSYDNLILLCPTCHTDIDKSPEGTYPVDMLKAWKRDHEEQIRSKGTEIRAANFGDLKRHIARLLLENRQIWEELGPKSQLAKDNPSSNLYELWNIRKLSTIVPNNIKILNIIESNIDLLDDIQYQYFLCFKNHATAFERHQYNKLDSYPLFPERFAEFFINE